VRLGNREFKQKREALADSDLELTRMVAEYEDWTPETIVDRQKEAQ
jgi:Protein of unknown function (DUF1524)